MCHYQIRFFCLKFVDEYPKIFCIKPVIRVKYPKVFSRGMLKSNINCRAMSAVFFIDDNKSFRISFSVSIGYRNGLVGTAIYDNENLYLFKMFGDT